MRGYSWLEWDVSILVKISNKINLSNDKSSPIKVIGNSALEFCRLGNEEDGPATDFPCGNEDDPEG